MRTAERQHKFTLLAAALRVLKDYAESMRQKDLVLQSALGLRKRLLRARVFYSLKWYRQQKAHKKDLYKEALTLHHRKCIQAALYKVTKVGMYWQETP